MVGQPQYKTLFGTKKSLGLRTLVKAPDISGLDITSEFLFRITDICT